MQYSGGTVLDQPESPTKKSVQLADVKYAVTVYGLRDRKFKFYRTEESEEPTFYKCFTTYNTLPVLNPHGDEIYQNTYAAYSFVGGSLTVDDFVTIRNFDGEKWHEEKMCIVDFTVHEYNGWKPEWLRDGAYGNHKLHNGRPPKVVTAIS